MADFNFCLSLSKKFEVQSHAGNHIACVLLSVYGLHTSLLSNLGFLYLLDNSNALNPKGFHIINSQILLLLFLSGRNRNEECFIP